MKMGVNSHFHRTFFSFLQVLLHHRKTGYRPLFAQSDCSPSPENSLTGRPGFRFQTTKKCLTALVLKISAGVFYFLSGDSIMYKPSQTKFEPPSVILTNRHRAFSILPGSSVVIPITYNSPSS